MTNYDSEKRALLRDLAFQPSGAFIAGGAVTSVFTGKPINDHDIYFKTQRDFDTAVADAYDHGLWCVGVSKRAVTFADDQRIAQLMHFDFFPTAADIFACFDFTMVMGAYDLDAKEFVLGDDFMRHNAQRFLRFNPGTRYPLASATRVLKFQDRDYTIGKGDILKIALACRGVRIESWEDLKDQIGGAYGDKVKFDGEDVPYSVEAAYAALSVESDAWIVPANDNAPGSAIELQRRIAELNGLPFDASRFEEGEAGECWPVELAA